METQMTHIGKSFVIKGELSCSEDLYIDGQVEGTIEPKGNRLTIGPNGRVKANIIASAVWSWGVNWKAIFKRATGLT